MTEITVGRRKYQGELVAESDSLRTADQPRWSEFYLYRLDDGRWLVQRIGRSVVYHRDPPGHVSPVTRNEPGEKTGTVEDLPDDAEPCDVCRPAAPRDLADGEQVRIESDRVRADIAPTPAAVTELLTVNRGRTGTKVGMAGPVRTLLEAAARSYPEFGDLAAASA